MSIMRVTGIGGYNAICQVCGWKYKAKDLKLRWDGLWVCKEDWEIRQPLDFLRTIPDQHPLPFVLPDMEDVPTSTLGYAQFDGSAKGYAYVPKMNNEFEYTYPITIEFWAYANPGSLGTNFVNVLRNEGRYIVHNQNSVNTGKFRFIIFDSPTGNAWSFPSTYVMLQNSNWYKFEFTATNNLGATLSVYDASGTQVSTEAIVPINLGVLGLTTPQVSIGGTTLDANGTWNGGIDELRVWNVIRTPDQLAKYRFKQISGGEAGLILYLNFDSPDVYHFDNRKYGTLYFANQGFIFTYPHVQWQHNVLVTP